MEIMQKDEILIRRYLLGEIFDTDEGESVEFRLLSERNFLEMVEIVADDLIEEYLEGTLPGQETHSFEQYFLKTPARHERLEFISALKHHAAAAVVADPTPDKAKLPSPHSPEPPDDIPSL